MFIRTLWLRIIHTIISQGIADSSWITLYTRNILFMFVLVLQFCFLFCVFCVLVLFCVLFLLLCRLFLISVQVYRLLPPGANPIAVNKYHIIFVMSCYVPSPLTRFLPELLIGEVVRFLRVDCSHYTDLCTVYKTQSLHCRRKFMRYFPAAPVPCKKIIHKWQVFEQRGSVFRLYKVVQIWPGLICM